jgi:5-methylcytosine-specific restriction endonuclease McrA
MTNKKGNGISVSKQCEEGGAACEAQAKKARPSMRSSGIAKQEKGQHVRFAEGKQAAALQKEIDGAQIWKQYEDLLIPRLRLTVFERALYSHLLRHSRLEGKRQLRFTILSAARGTGLSTSTVRQGVRALAAKGALRLAERSKRGHVIEVRLPEEVRAVRAGRSIQGEAKRLSSAADLEELNFLETRELREAIHAREGGCCFYCLRRVRAATRCIDHVIPQVRNGSNSYRNLVSSCTECNAQKCERDAEAFLRWLYREGRLGDSELKERLHAVEKLAAGKLRPKVGVNNE